MKRPVDRTRRSFDAMWQRCTNPKNNRFHIYGAAGITVCDRWRSYAAFREDMGERPPGMTLDREDGTKGYSPLNCRWATPAQQARNRKSTNVIAFRGKRLCLTDWAHEIGLSPSGLRNRIYEHGWSVSEALTTVKGGKRNDRQAA